MSPVHGVGEEGLEALLMQAGLLEVAASCAADWLQLADLYGAIERLDAEDHRWPGMRGHVYWLADLPRQALRSCWRALQLAPDDPVLLRGLANVLLDLNAFDLADRAYGRSQALGGGAATTWNHSQLLIGLERYQEGYAMAEQRWALPGYEPWRHPDQAGARSLADLQGPLLVWSEQGLGDTLQHLRWLGPLQRLRGQDAPSLVLEVEASLVPLVQQSLPTQSWAMLVRAKSERGAKPWFGRHISLLSLPWLLGGAPQPRGASWLTDPAWPPVRAWPWRRPRIGLVWAAGRKLVEPYTAREYWRRSLDPESLGALITGLAELGVELVLLQVGGDRDQSKPWDQYVSDWLPDSADFAATAATVAGLDLVISVDTSTAHLAGAMGRRCWLLLPYSAAPRWLRWRCDTPWYPSMRLYRQQSSGDWRSVVERVLLHMSVALHDSAAAI
jgi:hypothetical protein